MPSKKTLQLWCTEPHQHLEELAKFVQESPSRFNNFCLLKLNEAFVQNPTQQILDIINCAITIPNRILQPLELNQAQIAALSGDALAFNYIALLAQINTLELSSGFQEELLRTANFEVLTAAKTIESALFDRLPLQFQLQAADRTAPANVQRLVIEALNAQDYALHALVNDAISLEAVPVDLIDPAQILGLLAEITPETLGIQLNYAQKNELFRPILQARMGEIAFQGLNDEALEIYILIAAFLCDFGLLFQIFCFAAGSEFSLFQRSVTVGVELVAENMANIGKLEEFVHILKNLSRVEEMPKGLHKNLICAFMDLLSEKGTGKLLTSVFDDVTRLFSLYAGYLEENEQQDQEIMENCESWLDYVESWRGQ
ncbi:hypothetical protein SS50377_27239 [Spironucleus salmonicida]|uniref:Uncharacterized protein n=1 Tax=Spironucleus salmonicida TaxID=348837 RepID=V6LIG4_9EUKA|nr:hypothetical protein SS50377_27239 [Spironucleus salmonicida]|eukprot:EST44332.1 Hypothetical protein SS50377_15871 [Spironucleus salmonicida]